MIPPRVEYSLTPLGETLIRILAELCRWAEEHIVEVETAGPTHDARSADQRRDDEVSRRQAKGRTRKR